MYLHGFASSSGTIGLLRREFWEKADANHRAAVIAPVFEQHYPGMSSNFPDGHRLNAHVVVHTLLPYIRGLNLF